ncbi:MAG: PAS domain S-box protein, partial [Hydrogenophaga sp.]
FAAHLVICSVLIASVAGTMAHGTVRSSAVLVMLAGLVAAGSFLPRAALAAITVLCAASLGILNVMESSGMLPEPNLKTGWPVWITQVSVLVSMLMSVYFGRQRLIKSFRAQEKALQLAQSSQIEMRASQDRFKALFTNSPAACLVQSMTDNAVIDTNEAFIKMVGHSQEDLIGQHPPKLWASSEQYHRFRQTLEVEGRVADFHTTAMRRDGSEFPCVVNAEIVEQGRERWLIAMVVDLSVQQASRLALQKSEERFSKAFNFSPLGMTITRLSDGKFIEANPANERVLGYTPTDFLGETSMTVQVWLSQADRDRYVNTLKARGELMGYETRMRTKRGEPADVKVWAEIIEIDGAPCALSYTLNVTEEKRREAMLIEMAEGVSGDTGELFFRSLVTHMAKALNADLVIVGEIGQPGAVQTVAAWFDGQIVPNIVYTLEGTPCNRAVQTPGGHSFYAERLADQFPTDSFPIGSGFETYVGVALRDADGSPIGILKALWTRHQALSPDLQALFTIFSSRCNAELVRLRRDREIARLNETLEQRVRARTAQLEYANRELDTFAYSVSHDLKSPLRSIDGFLNILHHQMGDRMTAEDKDIFQRVSASASRMGGLIADMLSLARVSQGRLQRMGVNLSDLAESVIRQEKERDPTHEVEIDIAPNLRADCDPRLAQIVLENLIGNAWKYAHKKPSPRIEIGQMPKTAGDPAAFYVRDNGAGFDMARADRLFRPFTRLHSSNEFEGSGIGLATVRRILERHGGYVKAQG